MNKNQGWAYRVAQAIRCGVVCLVACSGCQTVPQANKAPDTQPPRMEAVVNRQAPQTLQSAIAYARQLEQEGKLAEAADLYLELLADQGELPIAVHRLAVINSQMGNHEQAEMYYRKALANDPRNAEIFCDLGYGCFLQNQLVHAETNYVAALNIDPEFKRAHNNLAVVFAKTGRNDEAMEQFRAAGCDERSARENLKIATTDQNEFTDDNRLAQESGQNRSLSVGNRQVAPTQSNVPVMNFSSPAESPTPRHIANPTLSSSQPDDSHGQQNSNQIAQVAFWAAADDVPNDDESNSQSPPARVEAVTQSIPPGESSSRRKHFR